MGARDRRILVTGSTRGIGLALAAHFVAEGARVAINGRREEAVREAVDSLGGDRLVPAAGDLTTAARCEETVRAAVEGLGGLDVLINNAGLYPIGSIEETDERTWDETMDTNVKSTFFVSRAALPALRRSRGCIINHASVAGLMGFANIGVYCASKGALTNLTRSMAMELAPEIRVNCVCPSTVDNEMGRSGFLRAEDPEAARAAFIAGSRLRRMPTNDDVVAAFAFLASPEARFMTGVALPVDGGRSAGA